MKDAEMVDHDRTLRHGSLHISRVGFFHVEVEGLDQGQHLIQEAFQLLGEILAHLISFSLF
jgi:hypothetical protein